MGIMMGPPCNVSSQMEMDCLATSAVSSTVSETICANIIKLKKFTLKKCRLSQPKIKPPKLIFRHPQLVAVLWFQPICGRLGTGIRISIGNSEAIKSDLAMWRNDL